MSFTRCGRGSRSGSLVVPSWPLLLARRLRARTFLHTTRNFEVARTSYHERRDHGKYLDRIRRTSLPEDCIVDLSTKQRQDVARITSSTCH